MTFIVGASIYGQGAGFHSASNTFKNALETIPQDDDIEDLYYYMRTVWEHDVSHYLYATVAHELPNEIGDFRVMVTAGRCTFTEALVTNVIGALSSLLGALIYLGADMSDRMTGMILTFGAAMFLFGATVDLPQEFMKEAKTGKQMLYIVSSFAVGCIVMGLVLLDHDHCDAGSIEGGGGGGDDGHNH